MEYYTLVGSYNGAIKIKGKWIRAVELNRIDKTGWKRRSGPPTAAITKALREQPPTQAIALFPQLRKNP